MIEKKNIVVIPVPEMVAQIDLSGKLAVVVDILRASSTITVALANGARSIIPVLTPEDAFNAYKELGIPSTGSGQRLRCPEISRANDYNVLLCGERHGKAVKGFHLGNSPTEYSPEIVSGKRLIFTTTNGTRALGACSDADELLVGSFLNGGVLCDYLAEAQRDVVIVCSGKQGNICIEDMVFAGLCVSRLKSNPMLTDATMIAHLLYERYQGNIPKMLRSCEHGKFLSSIGLAADLDFCAQIDVVDTVPVSRKGKIVKLIEGWS